MADDKNKKQEDPQAQSLLRRSPFNKLAGVVQQGLDRLYQNVTFNPSSVKNNREEIKREIDKALDNIISNNTEISGEGNVSRLIRRIQQMQHDPDTIRAFKDLFEDKQLMQSIFTSYSQNRYLYDYDAEIDVVLKYMPKLKEALLILKDNILSTDNFSKDFISATNISDITNDTMFDKRLNEIKKHYKLLEKFEDWYFNASKYGETFIYIIPYSRGITRLMKDRENINMDKGTLNMESFQYDLGGGMKPFPKKFNSVRKVIEGWGKLEIELCHANCVTSVLEEFEENHNKLKAISESSMQTYFTEQVLLEEKPPEKLLPGMNKPIGIDDKNVSVEPDSNIIKKLKRIGKAKDDKRPLIPDSEIDDYLKHIDKEPMADEGLVKVDRDGRPITKGSKKDKYDIPGAIVKELDRHNVIPIIIDDDICMGYYYFEFQQKRDFMMNSSMRLSDPMMSVTNGNNFASENDRAEQDKALRYIASELSKYIDSNFINKNQDLKKEIYAILKYNQIYNSSNPNKMRVTFIPNDDIEHIYFELDPYTKRGKSDLHESMLAAKLYSAMYITTSIMTMTRGYDKRVYYINPGIEANLTEAMFNVINQVKLGNFGIRQIRNNLNQVLNIQGRFNDYFILKSPSGDSPVNMEVISGQNVEIKTELMNILEEMAINPTGVPIELTQTRMNSMDYAIQLTMSSSKFLRMAFKRQGKVNIKFSRILEKVYNYHFKTNDTIEVTLPPPSFLTITNNTQFFDNLNNYAMNIAEARWDGDMNDEAGKQMFMKVIKQELAGSHYNKEWIDGLLQKSKRLSQIKPPQPQQQ